MKLVKIDTLTQWKNILPEYAPRIYIGDRWKTFDEWVKEDNRIFTSPCRKILVR